MPPDHSLVYKKLKSTSFHTILHHFHNNLWSYYIPIPKKIGDKYIEGNNRRVKCTVNNQTTIRSALMPKGSEYTIYMTNKQTAQLNLEEGDKILVLLEKDLSEMGMEIPKSFQLLLQQDEKGKQLFYQLTKGKQRSLIYIVKKVKNIDSQLAKALAIMHHIKEANGKLDFKRLNVLIKQYNAKNKM